MYGTIKFMFQSTNQILDDLYTNFNFSSAGYKKRLAWFDSVTFWSKTLPAPGATSQGSGMPLQVRILNPKIRGLGLTSLCNGRSEAVYDCHSHTKHSVSRSKNQVLLRNARMEAITRSVSDACLLSSLCVLTTSDHSTTMIVMQTPILPVYLWQPKKVSKRSTSAAYIQVFQLQYLSIQVFLCIYI